VLATAATDAVYVMFTHAWWLAGSSAGELEQLCTSLFLRRDQLHEMVYVAFAAAGSWIGAFASISFRIGPPGDRRLVQARNRVARMTAA